MTSLRPLSLEGKRWSELQFTSICHLGVYFDCKLSWKQNTDAVLKKVHTRLFCLRKLKSFHLRPELLQIFDSSSLSSVLTFDLSSWGGNTCKHDRRALDKIIKKASAVVGRTQDAFDALYDRRVTNKLMDILDDPTHPLRQCDKRLIQRSGRMRVPEGQNHETPELFCQPGCLPL